MVEDGDDEEEGAEGGEEDGDEGVCGDFIDSFDVGGDDAHANEGDGGASIEYKRSEYEHIG